VVRNGADVPNDRCGAGACRDRDIVPTPVVLVGKRKPSKVDRLAIWCRRGLDDHAGRLAMVGRTFVHAAHDLLSRDRWGGHRARRTPVDGLLCVDAVCALGVGSLA
jgi:hypothetical protein